MRGRDFRENNKETVRRSGASAGTAEGKGFEKHGYGGKESLNAARNDLVRAKVH